MQILEMPSSVADKIKRLLQPIMDTDERDQTPSDDTCRVWQNVLDVELRKWCDAVEDLADDGLELPTAPVVEVSVEICQTLRNFKMDPPSVIVPNGDGGLVLRWHLSNQDFSVEIETDGSIEARLMRDGRLVWRHCLHE